MIIIVHCVCCLCQHVAHHVTKFSLRPSLSLLSVKMIGTFPQTSPSQSLVAPRPDWLLHAAAVATYCAPRFSTAPIGQKFRRRRLLKGIKGLTVFARDVRASLKFGRPEESREEDVRVRELQGFRRRSDDGAAQASCVKSSLQRGVSHIKPQTQ